jgi:peptidoglycan/LPS O-acetylase OafA/YrhL
VLRKDAVIKQKHTLSLPPMPPAVGVVWQRSWGYRLKRKLIPMYKIAIFLFKLLRMISLNPGYAMHINKSHSRRYDLDWLRLIAFATLIYYHTAIIFVPGKFPLIQSTDISDGLQWFVSVSHQFRLALLFFISGIGVSFAKRRRNNREFIIERSKRLLIPLGVGLLLVVPMIVYIEKLFIGDVSGNFFEFYTSFFTNGIYPKGHLSWHHLWFIVYLYLFCVLGLMVFPLFDNSANRISTRVKLAGHGVGLYGLIIVLFVFEVPLRVIFLGGTPNLITDWANFLHWFLIFLTGYIIASDLTMLRNAERLRYWSLFGAIVSTVLLYNIFYENFAVSIPSSAGDISIKYIAYCAVRMTMVWTTILTCLGFAARYLQFSTPALGYLNEAVYPLFILHLLFVVGLGFFAVQWEMELWIKYLIITTGTFTIVSVIYHLLIRPFNLMRLLFGVKPK